MLGPSGLDWVQVDAPVAILALLAALVAVSIWRAERWSLLAGTLPVIVAATQIGLDLDLIGEASAAALVAAGLLSVIIFPALSLSLLKRAGDEPEACTRLVAPAAAMPMAAEVMPSEPQDRGAGADRRRLRRPRAGALAAGGRDRAVVRRRSGGAG